VIEELMGRFSSIFRLMGVAEEEISAGKERSPAKAAEIDKVFAQAVPPVMLRGKTEDLYRAHVREIVEAVEAGRPVPRATMAMAAAAFSDTSLKTPLSHHQTNAYHMAFSRCLPGALDLPELRKDEVAMAEQKLGDMLSQLSRQEWK
jgi:hypothetical protein